MGHWAGRCGAPFGAAHIFEDRRHHDARAARLRVEINHHGLVLPKDLLELTLGRHFLDGRREERVQEGEHDCEVAVHKGWAST